jgi:hypothetical protein
MGFRPFQAVVALSSLAFTVLVLELIRRRKIKDELWLPWLLVSATPFVMSLWLGPWELLARWLRIAYEPSLLLMAGILICIGLVLYLTVVVSTLMRQSLRLAQDVALLRHRLEMLPEARASGHTAS